MNRFQLFCGLLVLGLWLLPHQAVSKNTPAPTWEQTYGSGITNEKGEGYWSGYYLTQTSDDGFLASGFMLHGVYVGVLKVTADGTEQWQYALGSDKNPMGGTLVYENVTSSTFEFLGCLEHGLGIRAGFIYFMEFSAQGDTIKSRYTYSDEGDTEGVPVAQLTHDGNVILAAPVGFGPGQNKEFLLAKADKQGEMFWERRFAGKYEGLTGVSAVVQTEDGGYAFCAYSYPLSGTTASMVVIRTNEEGEQVWQYVYEEHFDLSADLQQTPDGGFLLLANQYRVNPYQRVIHLIKLDKDGKQQWERYIEKGEIVNGNSLYLHPSGSLFVAGYTAVYENRAIGKVSVKSYDSYVAKVGWDGTVVWEVNAVSGAFDMLRHVIATRDGGIAVTGQRNDSLYLAKFSAEVVSSAAEDAGERGMVSLLRIVPNPVAERAAVQYVVPRSEQIEIEVVDVLGKRVGVLYRGFQEAGEHVLEMETGGYGAGIYFVRLHSSVGTAVQQLVVQP